MTGRSDPARALVTAATRCLSRMESRTMPGTDRQVHVRDALRCSPTALVSTPDEISRLEPADDSWRGFLEDFASWGVSLDAVKLGHITPSSHREQWTEEQDAAYAALWPVLDKALLARFDVEFVELATDEGVCSDLNDRFPELFGEGPS